MEYGPFGKTVSTLGSSPRAGFSLSCSKVCPAQRSPVVARSRHGGCGGGNVLRIGVTEAAVAAQGRLALSNGGEATILAAEAGVIRAPRIILGLRARADPGRHGENCQHEKQGSHG